MAHQYQWLQLSTAQSLLAARLADPNFLFWTAGELTLYIQEALRTYNALTEVWLSDFVFNATLASGTWYDLSVATGSPRLRTLTDNDLITMMEYHLLEPPNGNALPWGGTSQFDLNSLETALQQRRDAMIQMTGCNIARNSALAYTPGINRVTFDDTVLEPRRVRIVPASGFGLSGLTLSKEDMLSFDYFEPAHNLTPALPMAWSIVCGPPLAMDTDTAPNVAGVYDLIYLASGPTFAAGTQTLLGVPDDWAWVAKWGALADLLGRESEATDRERAAYSLNRFNEGIKIMQQSNWIVRALIAGVPVDTPSLAEMDWYSPEWEQNSAAMTSLISAGTDWVAPCPVATGSQSIGVLATLVGNAPVPVNATDYVQISRDTWDAVLDYAQHLAAFKMGGKEFSDTLPLYQNFQLRAVQENKRLLNMGLMTDVVHMQGRREDIEQERYGTSESD